MGNERNILRGMRDRALVAYVRRCLDEGWTLRMNGSSHLWVINPQGDHVTISTTAKEGRTTQNNIAAIRRIGGPR